MDIYEVRRGDTLYSIADRTGTDASNLAYINQLTYPNRLVPGQALLIPTPPEEAPVPKRSIVTNGYAYPNIGNVALTSALPYLTYLSIFSYQLNADGSLEPVDDTRLIRASYIASTAPLLCITNTKTSGGFSSENASSVLNNPTARTNLINNILSTLESKSYFGVNVDLEYLFPEDRAAYNSFISELSEALQPGGYILMTALAPKQSTDQAGLLYEAHDYAFHGQVADYVILMTYEWGYLYGPPMATAPVNQVRKVLDYAVTQIPPEKILLGMPLYAYDWTLPYKKGTAAEILSPNSALNRAVTTGSTILFDQDSQTPYYNYLDTNGSSHVVWFEDPRSQKAQLELISEYGLGGVSYWNLQYLYRPAWEVLSDMFTIQKMF
ncbi:MAG: LysM peptidoglycan-binding domain-containing protein [Clostridia bacterium]|nr:LysM peptidoglycan-binding domain-containing protein [Clostridia bacterium]